MFSESTPEESPPGRKAVALLSGGLDSALAIYLVKRQGIDVVAVHFTSFFSLMDAGDEESPYAAGSAVECPIAAASQRERLSPNHS
jgi:tRNA U34 2-thiouridine synthase MnmA/TrmU